MKQELSAIAGAVEERGFAFVQAPATAALLERAGLCHWRSFAASWNDLGVDMYIVEVGYQF